MQSFFNVVKTLLRGLVLWVVDAVSLLVTSFIFPGITFATADRGAILVDAFAAALLLGIVNTLLRPLVLLLARPLGFAAVFALAFVLNTLALLLTSWLLPAFQVSGLLAAAGGGLVLAAINVVLTSLLDVDDEGTFHQSAIERLARETPFGEVDPTQRGLIMLEIDGLSFHHMQKAIADGRLPTLKRLMDQEGYTLSRFDCGLPSQTSACQAGIMFGDNFDIPAFRWYDKAQGKLYVSGKDAAEINARYARGEGLMRGGSSINNMLDGDATKSQLTLADLAVGELLDTDTEEEQRRAEDIYLLMLNPYLLTRTVALFLGDAGREVWQGWRQSRQGVEPRLNRLAHGYPFVRAATTVLMRDIAANLAILDIIRGAPSIYVTWPGYDEVAHHSGPWTTDAFGVLASYDKVVARVLKAAREKAPRPYDVIVLSDHGQSFGATFKQRYGLSLKEFIEQQLPQGAAVSQSFGGDTGATSLAAASNELGNIQRSGVAGRGGRVVARRSQRFLDNSVQLREASAPDAPSPETAQVIVCGSGNLAQVYFNREPRRLTLSELEAVYPGMVDALVRHEGIGLVCGYADDGSPLALGKGGQRNLHTGEVSGEDPLLPYAPADPAAFGHADVATRAWQVRRVMDFPSAGDLMVISTVYPDGTVAALEELIGNHGGLGGEQTDAFLFHPGDMTVPPTRNAVDVFHVLNARRALPVAAEETAERETAAAARDAWSWRNLAAGLRDVGTWLPLAGRAGVLDFSAYRRVVDDLLMTGPALLLGVVIPVLTTPVWGQPVNLLGYSLVRVIAFFLAVLVVFAAGRLLTREGTYTRTLRGLGFAQVVHLVELLALVPALAPLALPLGTILGFVALWMGASAAHNARGWRSVVLPILAGLVIVLLPIVAFLMFGGAAVSVDALLRQLGLNP